MSVPKVTAVVPNYNHARLLPRSLDALVGQTVPFHEIIVLDDCSKDDSFAIMEDYARRFPRVRIHRNEKNLGVSPTLNRGLAMAEGDYVGFYAADDQVLPHLLEHASPLLAAHPGCGMVSGICEWRCQTTGLVWYYGTTMPKEARFFPPEELVRLGKSGRLQVSAQPALYRKDALVRAGGWRPELRWHTDWFGSWVVAFRHGVCHIPEVLSVFNLYAGSFYHSVQSRAERREPLDRILRLLETDEFADVAGPIRESGLLGGFGWPMVRVIASHREHRRFLSPGFFRLLSRRTAEIAGRHLLPRWLARVCLRIFYGGK